MKYYQQRKRIALVSYSVALISLVVFLANPKWIAWSLMVYITLEVGLHLGIAALRRRFQWLITASDQSPKFSDALLTKFLADGFDPELGWSRKANTTKQEMGKYGPTRYHINEHGQRMNPGHENLPIKISTYGDSFTFCRQVNDNEAYQWHLSQLTQTNVLNYGVGNYGLDQAFLRMQREFPKHRSQIVILGVVPSTMVRIQSVWKHYNEFGNTLAFKPRFIMQGGTLKLIPNFINTPEKLKNYHPYLKEINDYDSFYESKFLAEMLVFPYCYSLLKAPRRHLSLLSKVLFGQQRQALDSIMAANLSLRQRLFQEADSLQLLNSLLDSFISYAKQQEFTPILMWMPQKDDILCIRSQGPYYQDFIQAAKQRMNVIDLTESLLKVENIENLYSDDSHYGGHLSKEGNKRIAHEIYQYLLSVNLLAPNDRHCVNVTEKDAQTI